jgi:hypothetical protein
MATTQLPGGPGPAATQDQETPTTQGKSGAIVRRELLLLGIALAFGFVLVPLAIWMVGNRILGPYTHGLEPAGGAMRLLGDFFEGLTHGSVIFWCVGLGPYFLIWFVRLFWGVIRYTPTTTTGSRS